MFYATDIHGSERCFTKFVNGGPFYKADVLVIGGDITGKYFIPVVEQADGTITATYLGKEYKLKPGKELDQLEQRIRAAGYYVYRTNPNDLQDLRNNPAKSEQIFETLITESLRRLMAYAEQKLKGTKIKCFVSPGNDDAFFVDKVLAESNTVINPEGQVIDIDGLHEMASTGYTNMTPWNCPRDISEEELMKRIDDMTSKLKNPSRSIFNFHCPPFDSTLDSAPQLDEKLQPKLSPSGPVMAPVGSTSVRTAIEKYQPLLGLHGHIHESQSVAKIGRTTCINPGSEYGEGVLRGCLVNFVDGEIQGYQMTRG